jgi:hypothetical protein
MRAVNLKRRTSRSRVRRSFARVDVITRRIIVLRGRKVVLDSELAALYGVTTKVLNQAVKRNVERFPEDFMFQISRAERQHLDRSQFVTGSQKHRDTRFSPYAFTEYGAIMAAAVLNSPRAVEMSLYVARAFVRLRDLFVANPVLAEKLDELERKVGRHDAAIAAILKTLRDLMVPQISTRRGIGFTADLSDHK